MRSGCSIATSSRGTVRKGGVSRSSARDHVQVLVRHAAGAEVDVRHLKRASAKALFVSFALTGYGEC